MTLLSKNSRVLKIAREFAELLQKQLNSEFIAKSFIANESKTLEGLEEIYQFSLSSMSLAKSLVELSFGWTQTSSFVVKIINLHYDYLYQLHTEINEQTQLQIAWPRLNVLLAQPVDDKPRQIHIVEPKKDYGHLREIKGGLYEEEEMVAEEAAATDEQSAKLPLFFLPLEPFVTHNNVNSVHSLEFKRHQKHQDKIREGHQHIVDQDYSKALKCFLSAFQFAETAEVLTLIGWTYSFMGKNEQAKNYCLQAIRKDSDYGPPYNDLGSYLLSEGQVEESLKWFELAKKAPNYQSREFPYINAGRAHMYKKNYHQALEEFNKALELAPFQDELRQTTERLKKAIAKAERSFDEAPAPEM
jgi:Tfp pilus assembly protein PilF